MRKVSAHQHCLAVRLSEYFFRGPAVFLASFYVQSLLEMGLEVSALPTRLPCILPPHPHAAPSCCSQLWVHLCKTRSLWIPSWSPASPAKSALYYGLSFRSSERTEIVTKVEQK